VLSIEPIYLLVENDSRSYVFAVEVAKATDLSEAVSTPELATKFNPTMPTPTTTQK
jgi:hypothetical protein